MANIIPNEAVPATDYYQSCFQDPVYDTRVVESDFPFYYPTSGIRNVTTLRWNIPAKKGPYVHDFSRLILAEHVKITNKARTDGAAVGIKCGPANNFILSMFKCLKIQFNHTVVCQIEDYPIYNYVSTLLRYDNNDMTTHLAGRCFAKEPALEFDTVPNYGWTTRRNDFGKIQKAKLEGEQVEGNHFVYSELATFFMTDLEHYLPTFGYLPDIDVTIELQLAKPEYCFQGDKEDAPYDINYAFERVKLFVPEYKLNDQLFLAIQNKLSNQAIRQYFTSTDISTYSIPTGTRSHILDTVGMGKMPQRIFVLLQETSRYRGDFKTNCFKFGRFFNTGGPPETPFMLESVKCWLANVEVEGLAADTATHSFRDQYYRFFTLLNQKGGRTANSITLEDFTNSSCFLIYDFTATNNQTPDPLIPLIKAGHLRLEINFQAESTCPMMCIVMMESSSSLTMEKGGKVTLSAL